MKDPRRRERHWWRGEEWCIGVGRSRRKSFDFVRTGNTMLLRQNLAQFRGIPLPFFFFPFPFLFLFFSPSPDLRPSRRENFSRNFGYARWRRGFVSRPASPRYISSFRFNFNSTVFINRWRTVRVNFRRNIPGGGEMGFFFFSFLDIEFFFSYSNENFMKIQKNPLILCINKQRSSTLLIIKI